MVHDHTDGELHRKWLEDLMSDNRIVEIRHLGSGRPRLARFTDVDKLLDVVEPWSSAGNLYTSLNRPLDSSTSGEGRIAAGLRDSDISVITRLPLDFDPVRPVGSASTIDELELAWTRCLEAVEKLAPLGLINPVLASSGNGAHAIYRVETPATPELAEALRTIYATLQIHLSDESVAFDPTVRNPSRVFRFYGTKNRKGIESTDRPHRVATIFRYPDPWPASKTGDIMALARALQEHAGNASDPLRSGHADRRLDRPCDPQMLGRGDYATLDVTAWFASHGAYGRPLGDRKHAVHCPWRHEHTVEAAGLDSSSVVWEAARGRWPTFHCSHTHCHRRSIRDVMVRWGDADRWCLKRFR